MVPRDPSFAYLRPVARSLEAGCSRCGSRPRPPAPRRLWACIVTVWGLYATAAQAQLNNPDIWLQNPSSTAFGVGANWNTNTVPTTANEVRVDSTSTQFPVLSGGSFSTGPIYFSYAGGPGPSSLTIQNGGSLTTSLNGQNVGVAMGIQPNTSAVVTVTGAGSQLTTTGSIWVGIEGSGTLNVLKGANVQSNTLTLGFNAGSQGVLNFGAAPGSAPASPGTLTTGAIFFGDGTGVINFNHTANNYVFATEIDGAGSVNLFSGTTTLSGTNSYSGNTNLHGGTAAVSNDSNLGTGALSFDGGTLEALAVGGGIVSSKLVTINAGGGTFLADAGTISTLSGAISGVGQLTKDGAGELVLTGINIYAGGTVIDAGTLNVNGPQALASGDVTVNAGTLQFSNMGSAGSAAITNIAVTNFFDTSTAASATIDNWELCSSPMEARPAMR